MALLLERKTVRIYPPTSLPGIATGDWLDIIDVYTVDMRRRVMRRGLAISVADGNDGKAKPNVSVDPHSLIQALVEEVIVGWSDSAPVTPENIGQMHADLLDFIHEEFQRITATRSEAEKNDLGGNSQEPSATREVSPPSSPTSESFTGSGIMA